MNICLKMHLKHLCIYFICNDSLKNVLFYNTEH
jgi:hypothetical protein